QDESDVDGYCFLTTRPKTMMWRSPATQPLLHHAPSSAQQPHPATGSACCLIRDPFPALLPAMAPDTVDPRMMSIRPRIRYNAIGGVNGPLVILENVGTH